MLHRMNQILNDDNGPERAPGRRAITPGPTGLTVAGNIARLRRRADMTTRQLSAALERAGRPIPPSGITRMEKGERVVTVDDLAALAVVLNVPPAALMLPPDATTGTGAEVTGVGEVPARTAWEWAHGMRPLPDKTGAEWQAWRLALPNGWRPMTARQYAEWSAEQARLDYEHIKRQAGPE